MSHFFIFAMPEFMTAPPRSQLVRCSISTLRVFTVAVALCAGLANAWAAADPATFRLTPALLDRMDAATAEVNKLPNKPGAKKAEDDDDDSDDESVEDIARKIDADPRVRAVLARHGLTSLEYATATLALFHAGMALAVEKAPGAKAGQQKFTPAQRANLELMRARQKTAR